MVKPSRVCPAPWVLGPESCVLGPRLRATRYGGQAANKAGYAAPERSTGGKGRSPERGERAGSARASRTEFELPGCVSLEANRTSERAGGLGAKPRARNERSGRPRASRTEFDLPGYFSLEANRTSERAGGLRAKPRARS